MKKYFLLLSIILITVSTAHSQRIVNKISRKICRCVKKENVKNKITLKKCFDKEVSKNGDKWIRRFKTDSSDYSNGVKIGEQIANSFIKNCPSIKAILEDEKEQSNE